MTVKDSLSPQTINGGFCSLAGWDSHAAPAQVQASVTRVLTHGTPPDHPVEVSNEIPPTPHKVRNPMQRPPSPGVPSPRGEGWHWDPWAAPLFPTSPRPLHLLGKEQKKTFRSSHTRNLAGPEDTSRPPASQSRRTCVLLPAMLTSLKLAL